MVSENQKEKAQQNLKTVWVSSTTHKALKQYCKDNALFVGKLVERLIVDYINKENSRVVDDK